jgi:hypothetical protein
MTRDPPPPPRHPPIFDFDEIENRVLIATLERRVRQREEERQKEKGRPKD